MDLIKKKVPQMVADWSDVVISQLRRAATRSWRKQKRILPGGFGGKTALLIP